MSVLTLQNGLIVACYQGYVDVVIALSRCPYLDVNWQDKEGNTALITAAQAGKHHCFLTLLPRRQTASIQSKARKGDLTSENNSPLDLMRSYLTQ